MIPFNSQHSNHLFLIPQRSQSCHSTPFKDTAYISSNPRVHIEGPKPIGSRFPRHQKISEKCPEFVFWYSEIQQSILLQRKHQNDVCLECLHPSFCWRHVRYQWWFVAWLEIILYLVRRYSQSRRNLQLCCRDQTMFKNVCTTFFWIWNESHLNLHV